MGASIDFSSDTHRDSSVPGTTETIVWKPDRESNVPYLFANSTAGLYFSIHKECMIYQVGTDAHGTVHTGKHGGVGFVNLSKHRLLGPTRLNRK